MPRIDPRALDSVCYLYHTAADASRGTEFGGTAFLVSLSPVSGGYMMAAVSTWHVAVRDGASVVRLNKRDGGTEVFEFGPEDWTFDPRYDVAVVHLILKDDHVGIGIPYEAFLAKKDLIERQFTPGEDVFMVGRFVDLDGKEVNRPTVRMGNISALPSPVQQPNGRTAEAFLIDMNSRSGYSGSPVFVYRTTGYDLEAEPGGGLTPRFTRYVRLLGIHFAQFLEEWEVVGGQSRAAGSAEAFYAIGDRGYVRGLSGMTCVLAAWHILDVLSAVPRDRVAVTSTS